MSFCHELLHRLVHELLVQLLDLEGSLVARLGVWSETSGLVYLVSTYTYYLFD